MSWVVSSSIIALKAETGVRSQSVNAAGRFVQVHRQEEIVSNALEQRLP